MMPTDAEPYYQVGLAFLGNHSYENAVAAFQKALSLNPNHSGAQLKLAALMTTSPQQSVLQDAKKRLQDLLGAPQKDSEAMDTLAFTEWKLGKPEEASRILDEALSKFPADAESYIVLARIKLSLNDPDGAEEVLKKWVANTPASREAGLALGRLYLQLRKPDKAEAEFRRTLTLDPKYAPALFSLALIQASGNRLADAEQTFKQLTLLPSKEYQHLYALFLFQQGKRDQAVAEFQRLAKADPGDREARTRLITAHVLMDRIPEAEKLLSEALKRNPKDTEALLQSSELRLRVGDIETAETDLNRVISIQPDSAPAHFQLARVKGMRGSEAAARHELTQAVSLDRNLLPARVALARRLNQANEFKAALDVVDEAPTVQKTNLDLQIERNWAELGMNDIKEAREGIDRALSIARVPDLVVQDGVLGMKEKNFAHAQADADEALSRDPENSAAFRLLVESCGAQKQLPKAVQKMRELAANAPQSSLLQFELGQALVTAGDGSAGRKSFEAAVVLDSKYAAPRLALAELDARAKRWDAARENLNAVLASNPRNVLALRMAGDLEESLGNHPAAIAKYRSVLDVDGSNILAMNNLAYLLATDNPDEALKLAQQGVDLAPDNAALRDTLGWIYYRRQIYRSAVEQLKIAVAKEPTPWRQFHLAMSYLKLGDRDLGQRTLGAALKQDPNLTKTELGW
jgi:tetratricopeptide (TPR) repeat protein